MLKVIPVAKELYFDDEGLQHEPNHHLIPTFKYVQPESEDRFPLPNTNLYRKQILLDCVKEQTKQTTKLIKCTNRYKTKSKKIQKAKLNIKQTRCPNFIKTTNEEMLLSSFERQSEATKKDGKIKVIEVVVNSDTEDECEYMHEMVNIDESCLEYDSEEQTNTMSIQDRIAQLHKDIAEIKSRMANQVEFEVNEEHINLGQQTLDLTNTSSGFNTQQSVEVNQSATQAIEEKSQISETQEQTPVQHFEKPSMGISIRQNQSTHQYFTRSSQKQ